MSTIIARGPGGRWAAGQSGNPSGKRKRPQTIRGAIREKLRAEAPDGETGIDKLVGRLLTMAATFDDLLNLAKFLEGPHPAQKGVDGDLADENTRTLRDFLDDLRNRREPGYGEAAEATVDAIEDALREAMADKTPIRDLAEHLAQFVGARPTIVIPGLNPSWPSVPAPNGEDED